MSEKGASGGVVENYIVTFRTYGDDGKPRCRADRIVSLKKTKNSNNPMEFIESGKNSGVWINADHPIGSILIRDSSFVIV